MASDSAFSFTLGVTVVEMRATCNNNASSLRFKKRELRRIAPSLFLLSLIACTALILTPHVLATGL